MAQCLLFGVSMRRTSAFWVMGAMMWGCFHDGSIEGGQDEERDTATQALDGFSVCNLRENDMPPIAQIPFPSGYDVRLFEVQSDSCRSASHFTFDVRNAPLDRRIYVVAEYGPGVSATGVDVFLQGPKTGFSTSVPPQSTPSDTVTLLAGHPSVFSDELSSGTWSIGCHPELRRVGLVFGEQVGTRHSPWTNITITGGTGTFPGTYLDAVTPGPTDTVSFQRIIQPPIADAPGFISVDAYPAFSNGMQVATVNATHLASWGRWVNYASTTVYNGLMARGTPARWSFGSSAARSISGASNPAAPRAPDGTYRFRIRLVHVPPTHSEFCEALATLQRERQTQRIQRFFRIPPEAIAAGGPSEMPAVSADGSTVAFVSAANLTADDTNQRRDVYVYDRNTRALSRIDTRYLANLKGVWAPELSADGRFVSFLAVAADPARQCGNLPPWELSRCSGRGQTPAQCAQAYSGTRTCNDAYRWDRETATLAFVAISVSPEGTAPVISPNGRYVVTREPGANSEFRNIHVYDIQNRTRRENFYYTFGPMTDAAPARYARFLDDGQLLLTPSDPEDANWTWFLANPATGSTKRYHRIAAEDIICQQGTCYPRINRFDGATHLSAAVSANGRYALMKENTWFRMLDLSASRRVIGVGQAGFGNLQNIYFEEPAQAGVVDRPWHLLCETDGVGAYGKPEDIFGISNDGRFILWSDGGRLVLQDRVQRQVQMLFDNVAGRPQMSRDGAVIVVSAYPQGWLPRVATAFAGGRIHWEEGASVQSVYIIENPFLSGRPAPALMRSSHNYPDPHDVDNNGTVNAVDVSTLENALLRTGYLDTHAFLSRGLKPDVDKDGRMTWADLMQLASYVSQPARTVFGLSFPTYREWSGTFVTSGSARISTAGVAGTVEWQIPDNKLAPGWYRVWYAWPGELDPNVWQHDVQLDNASLRTCRITTVSTTENGQPYRYLCDVFHDGTPLSLKVIGTTTKQVRAASVLFEAMPVRPVQRSVATHRVPENQIATNVVYNLHGNQLVTGVTINGSDGNDQFEVRRAAPFLVPDACRARPQRKADRLLMRLNGKYTSVDREYEMLTPSYQSEVGDLSIQFLAGLGSDLVRIFDSQLSDLIYFQQHEALQLVTNGEPRTIWSNCGNCFAEPDDEADAGMADAGY
jgi:hypothetical protein